MNITSKVSLGIAFLLLCTVPLALAVIPNTPDHSSVRSGAATSTSDTDNRYNLAIKRSRQLVRTLMKEARIPGLAVAVAIEGEIVWQEGFGYADLENLVPLTDLTRFRIGSVSKSLTAAAMARLYEKGRLDLDAHVREYVPSFPRKKYPITPRLLAGHLGGIRHYREGESINYQRFTSVVESLQHFQDDALLHEPGTAFRYSTYGYNLLGAVIESACGKKFTLCMKEEVFLPLGMTHTVADFPDQIIPHRTRFYARNKEGELVNAPYSDRSYKIPGGGFLSTASDLVRFGSGLLQDAFLRRATIEMLFTSQRTQAGEETGYGMGWRPRTDWEGRLVLQHGGSAEGGRTFLLLYPRQGLAVALLANLSGAPLFQEEAQTLATLFLDDWSNSSSEASSDEPSGLYEMTIERGDKTVKGMLYLINGPSGPKGWLRLENSSPLILALILKRDEEVHIIGAGRQGMVNLWATFTPGGLEGRWNWLGRTETIRGVQKLPSEH
jgi:CubicO group peptidase (beta-lactamase class C family)